MPDIDTSQFISVKERIKEQEDAKTQKKGAAPQSQVKTGNSKTVQENINPARVDFYSRFLSEHSEQVALCKQVGLLEKYKQILINLIWNPTNKEEDLKEYNKLADEYNSSEEYKDIIVEAEARVKADQHLFDEVIRISNKDVALCQSAGYQKQYERALKSYISDFPNKEQLRVKGTFGRAAARAVAKSFQETKACKQIITNAEINAKADDLLRKSREVQAIEKTAPLTVEEPKKKTTDKHEEFVKAFEAFVATANNDAAAKPKVVTEKTVEQPAKNNASVATANSDAATKPKVTAKKAKIEPKMTATQRLISKFQATTDAAKAKADAAKAKADDAKAATKARAAASAKVKAKADASAKVKAEAKAKVTNNAATNPKVVAEKASDAPEKNIQKRSVGMSRLAQFWSDGAKGKIEDMEVPGPSLKK